MSSFRKSRFRVSAQTVSFRVKQGKAFERSLQIANLNRSCGAVKTAG
jgi:hypothetical protein